ncbi:MAG: glycerol-3-phosphate 1-O-acyltransferase PlsY [Proteobacteria bacterium]|nr:glycerol-3-phosphate 1-O-acyltransferase PlsY [Pseudomonadota bacterium]MBU1397474.1 glycerol-3-phosphate 1-O-acyltransferase PlsY [Pseudomonadota bacterium]MBU1569074.1 glycerol-3-phosphate 1-O-acyltransferase PlsY [Pseudomonadota bacterium]
MDLFEIIKFTGLVIGAYLLGSVPFGLILTKRFTSINIRTEGSGNIGATNVRRLAGTKLGLFTLAGDFLKGVLPVYLAGVITGCETPFIELYVCVVAVAVFFGHLYPVFLKFQGGGKGVATAAGCFLVISPWAFLAAVTAFTIVTYSYKRASAGSLIASAVLPVAVWFTGHSIYYTSCAVIISMFIFFRHRENINRLLSGTEPVI